MQAIDRRPATLGPQPIETAPKLQDPTVTRGGVKGVISPRGTFFPIPSGGCDKNENGDKVDCGEETCSKSGKFDPDAFVRSVINWVKWEEAEQKKKSDNFNPEAFVKSMINPVEWE